MLYNFYFFGFKGLLIPATVFNLNGIPNFKRGIIILFINLLIRSNPFVI